MPSTRRHDPDGDARRWVTGQGGEPPEGAVLLVQRGRGKRRRWSSAGRKAGRGVDQVGAERLLWALVDAGLARVRERRNRKGDWEPYQWELTEAGEVYAERWGEALDVREYLAVEDPLGHELLEQVRAWLEAGAGRADPVAVRLVVALGEELRAGRIPRGRVLSIRVAGRTKAVRIEDHREAVEAALGQRLEDVVRLTGVSVLAYGPFRFTLDGRTLDGEWSKPWLALTQDTLAAMTELSVGSATRLLTVENLVPFEEEVRAGLPPDTIAVFAAGFPHGLVRDFLARLIEAGVREVDHWGDLDLGGLRILRHLDELLPVPVRPFRMEPELLEVLPTQPLTDYDREGLRAWVETPEAPHKALAGAMLALDRKAEQEGWLMLGG